jgi:flavin reductase (DIM6/NTAB) family NADH-FMN oxidoreductase RutF
MDLHAASALFGQVDRALWLVTARAGARRGGLIATFVCDASLVEDLPRALVGLARHHHTWELVEASGAFALHLLDEAHLGWVWQFGLCSGRDVDKFAGLSPGAAETGSPLLLEAPGWLDCRVELRMDTGDRSVYLAEVVRAKWTPSTVPLTFQRLLQLAPPEKRQELEVQRRRDSDLDARAIRRWRQEKGHDDS